MDPSAPMDADAFRWAVLDSLKPYDYREWLRKKELREREKNERRKMLHVQKWEAYRKMRQKRLASN